MENTVCVLQCENYSEENVRNALLEILEKLNAREFIKQGVKVGIKVNLLTAAKPEKAVTTNPVMVSELCRIISEMGATAVIGDSPGGPFNQLALKPTYFATKMTEAEKYGAKLNMNFAQKDAFFNEAESAKAFKYTAWLDDVDVIINFAKLKTHGMMGITACVKNLFGTIPGTIKPEYHLRFPTEEKFADMLIDLNEYFKPSLNLVDAVIGMEGNGPGSGDPKFIGAVIGSESPYLADMVCAKIINAPFDTLPTVTQAIKRKLCPESIDKINVIGDIRKITDFKLVRKHKNLQFFDDNGIFKSLFKKAMDSRPEVKIQTCIGCGKCKDVCPAKAIVMKNKKPYIERSKCIKCFCCQEFCPKGAIVVHKPFVAKILSKI